MRKMLEHSIKAVVQDGKAISGAAAWLRHARPWGQLRCRPLTNLLARVLTSPRPAPGAAACSGGAARLCQALPQVHGPSVPCPAAAAAAAARCAPAAVTQRGS